MHHKLVAIEIPPRNYRPRDFITVPDPWDRPMVLEFISFLNPQMFGPVTLEVASDGSGRIPYGSQFMGTARTMSGRTIIVWLRVTFPNGQVGWAAPSQLPNRRPGGTTAVP
jgi:hypothetical protein